MKIFALFILFLFFSSFSFADFDNQALIDLKNSGDSWADYALEICTESDNIAPLSYVMGDTSNPSKKVKVFYQYIISDKNNPTLIFLPGGPGGHSIGDSEDFEHLTSLFNILYFDPRGFGCSFMGEEHINYDDLKSERVADDLLKIVQKESLKDFYIYGVSFGTLLGTIATKTLEDNNLPPQALILEGVLGPAFKNWPEVYTSIIADNFNSYLKQETWVLDLLNQIDSIGKDSFSFFDSHIKGLFSDNGTIAPNDWVLEELLKFKNLDNISLLQKITKFEENQFTNTGTVDIISLRSISVNTIACSELSEQDIDHDVYWDKNSRTVIAKKVLNAADVCASYSFLNPYNPKDFQISSPIYYFQGDEDPATPLNGALNHFTSQRLKENKHFIKVKNSGHSPFYEAYESCSLNIWAEIQQNPGDAMLSLNSDGHCK